MPRSIPFIADFFGFRKHPASISQLVFLARAWLQRPIQSAKRTACDPANDYVRTHFIEEISIEMLAELAELGSFHFCRVSKRATGMMPLQFVTRERVLKAQRLIRETPSSLIEIALEVGYTSPSYFAQVFRKVVGMAPNEFRSAFSARIR